MSVPRDAESFGILPGSSEFETFNTDYPVEDVAETTDYGRADWEEGRAQSSSFSIIRASGVEPISDAWLHGEATDEDMRSALKNLDQAHAKQ